MTQIQMTQLHPKQDETFKHIGIAASEWAKSLEKQTEAIRHVTISLKEWRKQLEKNGK